MKYLNYYWGKGICKMTVNERVDIVMVMYNSMRYIREQVQFILWQDYRLEVRYG